MTGFYSYTKIGENRYRERFGLSFEEFQVGQEFKHRPGVTVSQQDNKEEALDTINNAQLHYDAHYASKTEWGKCLTVSTLTLQRVLGASWKTFGKKLRVIAYDDISMTKPVYEGDTLYAESVIVGKDNSPDNPDVGVLEVVTSGVNQRGDVVCKIAYRLLVFKQGKGREHIEFPNAQGLNEERFRFYKEESGVHIEQLGLYYDDLEVGETYVHFPSKTFSKEESRMHALRSLDWNPIYSDDSYIEKYTEKGFPVNEVFLIGAISALTTRTFARVVANLQWKNVILQDQVWAGDTVSCESTILTKRPSGSRPAQGIVGAKTEAFNQEGRLVCSFERHFLVYKKGLGPYGAAGY